MSASNKNRGASPQSGGGGAGETRLAINELLGELDRTRKEYAKATLQLAQLETSVQHLKDSELKKDQVIGHLEAELERTKQHHQQEINLLQEEHQTKDTAWAHRVKHMELELKRIEQENETASAFEKENRTLRDTVLEHQATIESLQLINEDLRSRARDDTREQAALLEEEFKRRLAEAEKKFRAEAYRALSEEAKIALQGNDHLQAVLQRQNDSIEAVLLRCKQLEQSHTKVSHEQELSAQALQHHVTEIQRLKKQLNDSKSRNAQLEDNLKQRKVERASLELLYLEYESTRKQLQQAEERSRRSTREASRWKNRAVQLAHELGEDQREIAEAKILHLQQQSDQVEQSLAKRKKQTKLRNKIKSHQSQVASAYRTAEKLAQQGTLEEDDEWSQISEDEEDPNDVLRYGGDSGQQQQLDPGTLKGAEKYGLNPMDLLAMWNVNFQTYRGTPETGGAGGGSSSLGHQKIEEQQQQREQTLREGEEEKEALGEKNAAAEVQRIEAPPTIESDAQQQEDSEAAGLNEEGTQLKQEENEEGQLGTESTENVTNNEGREITSTEEAKGMMNSTGEQQQIPATTMAADPETEATNSAIIPGQDPRSPPTQTKRGTAGGGGSTKKHNNNMAGYSGAKKERSGETLSPRTGIVELSPAKPPYPDYHPQQQQPSTDVVSQQHKMPPIKSGGGGQVENRRAHRDKDLSVLSKARNPNAVPPSMRLHKERQAQVAALSSSSQHQDVDDGSPSSTIIDHATGARSAPMQPSLRGPTGPLVIPPRRGGGGGLFRGGGANLPPGNLTELSVVSHGEFRMSRRVTEPGAQRFIVP